MDLLYLGGSPQRPGDSRVLKVTVLKNEEKKYDFEHVNDS
jgi:hypothetical protein